MYWYLVKISLKLVPVDIMNWFSQWLDVARTTSQLKQWLIIRKLNSNIFNQKVFFKRCIKMLSIKWQTLCASLYWLEFKPLGPSDAIWRQRSGSTLTQVMACCLTAPNHYLNQCWLIASEIQLHSSDGNFTRDTHQSSVTKIDMKITHLKCH